MKTALNCHRRYALVFALLAAPALASAATGNLFESDTNTGVINRFTSAGVKTTFVFALNGPYGLAFDSAGNLFEADYRSGSISSFTPAGVRSSFATGLNGPTFLAFGPSAVPEPATWMMLIVGCGLLVANATKTRRVA